MSDTKNPADTKDSKTSKLGKAAVDQAISEFVPGIVRKIPESIRKNMKLIGLDKFLPFIGIAASALMPSSEAGSSFSDIASEFTAELRKAINEAAGTTEAKTDEGKKTEAGNRSGLAEFLLSEDAIEVIVEIMTALDQLYARKGEKEISQINDYLNRLSAEQLYALLVVMEPDQRKAYAKRMIKIKTESPSKTMEQELKELIDGLDKIWVAVRDQVLNPLAYPALRRVHRHTRVNLATLGFPMHLTAEEASMPQSILLGQTNTKLETLATELEAKMSQPIPKRTRFLKFW